MVPEGTLSTMSLLAWTLPKCLWMCLSSTFMGRFPTPTPAPSLNFGGGSRSRGGGNQTNLWLNALAFHALEQLRQVPDLLIGGNFAIFQIGAAILQIDRAFPQVESTGEFSNELIQSRAGIGREGFALHEADRAGVFVVDVLPIRAVPLKFRFEGAVGRRGNDLRVRGTPVEVRHTEADIGRGLASADVIIGDGPNLLALSRELGGFLAGFGRVNARDDDIVTAVVEIICN